MPRYSGIPNREAFYAAVWDLVRQIPPGRVSTYGRLATLLPLPEGVPPTRYAAFGARWVGGAMRHCPADVPWQRVLNASGKISQRGGESPSIQRALLEAEGITFDARDRVNLDKFGWAGPEAGLEDPANNAN